MNEAIGLCRQRQRLEPNDAYASYVIGKALTRQGLYEEAAAEFRKGLAAPELSWSQEGWILSELGYVYGVTGKRAEAMGVLERLKKSDAPWRLMEVAKVYAGMGERDEAFAWLGRAADERFPFLWAVRSDPDLESLSSDPRYGELLRSLNLRP